MNFCAPLFYNSVFNWDKNAFCSENLRSGRYVLMTLKYVLSFRQICSSDSRRTKSISNFTRNSRVLAHHCKICTFTSAIMYLRSEIFSLVGMAAIFEMKLTIRHRTLGGKYRTLNGNCRTVPYCYGRKHRGFQMSIFATKSALRLRDTIIYSIVFQDATVLSHTRNPVEYHCDVPATVNRTLGGI